MPDRPLAYFITFTTYGTWLHGESPSSVDENHNKVGAPFVEPNSNRRIANQRRMAQEAYLLDPSWRQVVCDAIVEECAFRGWTLHAIHVRSNHVHLVVTAERDPEFVMRACKSNASKRLNQAGMENTERKRWTAHGSTRYLWTEEAVAQTVQYTLSGQGDAMAAFSAKDLPPVQA